MTGGEDRLVWMGGMVIPCNQRDARVPHKEGGMGKSMFLRLLTLDQAMKRWVLGKQVYCMLE